MSEKVGKDKALKIGGGRSVENFCQKDDKPKIYISIRLMVMERMQRKNCKVWDLNKMVAYTAVG